MSHPLDPLFEQFHQAAQAATEQDNKWLIIDAVYEQLDALRAFPLTDVLPRILALIEAYPELDYGGPGPFGSLIEEHPMADYMPQLLASLQRQPSTQVIGWLDRGADTDDLQLPGGLNPISSAQYQAALEQVLQNPQASADCKEFAQMCLGDLK